MLYPERDIIGNHLILIYVQNNVMMNTYNLISSSNSLYYVIQFNSRVFIQTKSILFDIIL